MENYAIIYKQTLSNVFYVEAENKKAAEKKFAKMQSAGELDFSHGKIVKVETEIYED